MNYKSNVSYLLSLAAVLVMILSGCYPKGPEYLSDYNLVYSKYNQDFDFGSKTTYYMPDTIDFETNIDDFDEETIREVEQLILTEFEKNMTARGYLRVDTTHAQTPDLIATISAVALENAGVGWVPSPGWGWWGGYYPPGWGWGPGWGWYYPGWYPVGYSYDTGTVIMHLGDPDDIIEDGDNSLVNVVWLGALDGILSSSADTNEQRIVNGIDQVFVQSPYLQSN